MKVSALTLLILHINSLIDSGNYTDITIGDIHKAIEGKRVLRFLKEQAGEDIDLSIHLDSQAYGDFESYYENQLENIYGGYAGQERRKWGIENSGLCLVLAWTNEIIQQGQDLKW
ncbi:hypothetical protein H2Y56_18800 [Pectobacterium aroidearum]|uniref:Uncharacterized protein n=1 Tax=Pectobacterium aroidearum TaxID=1201031 RepID=A0ABR5ZI28_9GAMM|nr:hypothetical protein [Pectobacterium aroidearum]MBA5201359.1 hypothetical protein [Pectobacterium aroidearum]MBA5234143.1 hypothetical protein [Pectobacterium aroidearum]MBA5739335.1 hypothetical protein [Pectobacterium aroidearum]